MRAASNLFRLGHYRFLAEIMRFNREARRLLQDPASAEITLEGLPACDQFGGEFTRYYLHPMAAAVWSISPEEIEDFPAFTLIRFLENHGSSESDDGVSSGKRCKAAAAITFRR